MKQIEMRLFSVETGKSKQLMNPLQEGYLRAWSPDSTLVAALTGLLQETLGGMGLCDQTDRIRIRIALTEALTNAFRHASAEEVSVTVAGFQFSGATGSFAAYCSM